VIERGIVPAKRGFLKLNWPHHALVRDHHFLAIPPTTHNLLQTQAYPKIARQHAENAEILP
jgi:hypothetical protein